MKALVLYDSQGGNTEKVARQIHRTLEEIGHESDLVQVGEDVGIDLEAYEILFMGAPVHAWLPTEAMIQFVKKKMQEYREAGMIVPASPIRKGKFAVCFCTYSGTHIGKDEAVPATKWLGAFAGHIRYLVVDEWHIVGQFRNRDELNTGGRLGNITGRPNTQDLKDVENRVKGLMASLAAWQQ